MSHLPLDARAILHYLNELGYRNISAEQLKEFLKDLRKLIKYEERIGVNILANGVLENLCQTTASFRAKTIQEDEKPQQCSTNPVYCDECCYCGNTNKNAILREKVLNKNKMPSKNPCEDKLSVTSSKINICKCSMKNVQKKTQGNCNTVNLIEDLVCEVLNRNLKKLPSDSIESDQRQQFSKEKNEQLNKLRPIVLDMVVKFFEDKFCPQKNGNDCSALAKPINSVIECIVMKKLKEFFPESSHQGQGQGQGNSVTNNNIPLDKPCVSQKANDRFAQPNKTLETEALMAELLADSKSSAKQKQNSTSTFRKPEWQQTSNRGSISIGIKRLPFTMVKSPEWQKTTHAGPKRIGKPNSTQSTRRSSGALVPIMTTKSKPMNTDPVALYQYYRKEWDHFAKQIPEATKRNSERWHVRERFINIEK